jgi:two-component system, sensor histidine kinase and response regulator
MDWKTCFKGKKVLIAEDDSVTREMMQDVFELMGCDFTFALDGNEAVEKYKEGKFEILLMDIRMPNKDGETAIKEIRALEKEGERIPIIALTASIEKQLGDIVDARIEKPIHLEDLRTTMAKLLLKEE